jgi:hypothetical protein
VEGTTTGISVELGMIRPVVSDGSSPADTAGFALLVVYCCTLPTSPPPGDDFQMPGNPVDFAFHS